MYCSRIHFTFTKTKNKLKSKKSRVFKPLIGLSETGKTHFDYKRLKNGTVRTKYEKVYFFYQHSQTLYGEMQKEIENLEFAQGVNFEITDSLKNNGTKSLLFFDDSYEETCNSKAFVGFATASRHRGLSTIYIKHNLFH